jgi:hypothetical protein
MYSHSAGRQGMSCTDIFRSSDFPVPLCAGGTDSREISMRLLVLALLHWLEQSNCKTLASASGNGTFSGAALMLHDRQLPCELLSTY